MEDAHAAVLNLTEGSGKEQVSVFAVYDGHGGMRFFFSRIAS
jgi:serine/threonine protein phosphatase PrpC